LKTLPIPTGTVPKDGDQSCGQVHEQLRQGPFLLDGSRVLKKQAMRGAWLEPGIGHIAAILVALSSFAAQILHVRFHHHARLHRFAQSPL
jgi:hypothetical protein